jgi:signal transduction histidine kinase
LSIGEEFILGTVHGVFTGTVSLSRRIMDQVDEQRILLVNLSDGLDEIDRIVHEDVQPLIAAETAQALDGAESSVGSATLALFLLIALGVVVGLGTAMIVGRQIVNPIVRLTNVAVELGRGNLAVRADAETNDEIGSLANSFNQMAAARQQAEAQRGALIAELAGQNATLAELDEMKDNFLSSVSHELRTPLTAIKGSAELLLDDQEMPEEVQREFLTIINLESDRLTRLINDVLDLSRYEAGQEVWNDAPHAIGEIVDTAVSGIQSLAIQRSLAIDVSLEPDLPDVWCDSDKINQVLTNLLSNAIKFTPESGKIGISVKELAGGTNGTESRIMEVQVSDNEIGIPKRELAEIFEKFKQVRDAPTDVQKDTGLGLPICKEIVSHYGGSIWAESEMGKGTVLTFNLPFEKGIEPDSPVTIEDPDSSKAAAL